MDRKKIKIKGKEIEYVLKKRKGARSVKLSIYQDGYFVVTAPKWYPLFTINKFIEEKAQWIFEKLKDVDFDLLRQKKESEAQNYRRSVKLARVMIRGRVEFFNRHYDFAYKRIAIRNQRTCWGSCSQKANLNFNYKIINLPEELRDYVIIHELCHLKELNHSVNFWKLVSETAPDYKALRKELKGIK